MNLPAVFRSAGFHRMASLLEVLSDGYPGELSILRLFQIADVQFIIQEFLQMKVKGFFQDVTGISRIVKAREQSFKQASSENTQTDPIRALADAIHPDKQVFTVTKVYQASPTARTFRFEPENGHVAPFRCGQYANFCLTVGSSRVTRAYSISSAPFEARGDKPFFEITIRRNRPYFVPDWFFENVKEGSKITAALPFSQFYYEPLRDSGHIMALAGGSGITPFVSMAKEIAHGSLDVDLTIVYGSVRHTDIVCGDQIEEARAKRPDKIHVVHVMSDDPEWEGEKGFVTKEIMEKYSVPDMTYFFCGPLPMYNMVRKNLEEMGVPARRFRHDAIAQPANVKLIPGFPEDQIGKTYRITVVRGIQKDVIDARADESVAVALERAAIPVDTHCRAGECGFCRSQLLDGTIFVSPLGDGRRKMDKEFGWFHACSSYPTSDLTIRIPIL